MKNRGVEDVLIAVVDGLKGGLPRGDHRCAGDSPDLHRRTSREVRTEIIEDVGLTVPLVIPRQKGETELAIRETTIAGRRYIICRNEEEAKKDAATRASSSPASNASWRKATRRSSPTRASAAS